MTAAEQNDGTSRMDGAPAPPVPAPPAALEGEAAAGGPAPGGTLLTTENVQEMLQAQQEMAEAHHSELLRHVFDSMATNGKITLDQLPFVLVGAEVQATAKEIEDAIEEHLPDADDADALLDFQQVEGLYRQLLLNAAEVHLEMPMVQAPTSLSLPERLRRWWRQRKQPTQQANQTAYEKQMKPTRRLLMMILFTSCFISIAVVVFSIVYIWDHSTSTVKDHIMRDMQLLKDGIDLFGYQNPTQSYSTNMQRISGLMAQMVEELGYRNSEDTMMQNMDFQQQLLSTVLDGWFKHDVLLRVETNNLLVKGWLDLMGSTNNESVVLDMVNAVNMQLPTGHEIVISRSANTTTGFIFLSILRYKALCVNGTCGSDPTAAMPTRLALTGQTGSLFGNDYRPTPVVAAYSYLASMNFGIVYKIDQSVLRDSFYGPVSTVVNGINTKASATAATGQDAYEVVLARRDDTGTPLLLTQLGQCNATCLSKATLEGSPAVLAADGQTGAVVTPDYNGEDVMEAYSPLPYAGIGAAIKTPMDQFFAELYAGVAVALDAVNAKLTDSQEVQLATAGDPSVFNSSTSPNTSDFNLTFYTAFKQTNDCVGACNEPSSSEFMRAAVSTCQSGLMTGPDYRQQPVIAGYACVPSLKAGLVLKIDQAQIVSEGISLADTIATYESYTRFANSSMEFMLGKLKPGVLVPKSARDFDRITVLKLRQDCPNMTCVGPSDTMVAALQRETGVMEAPDYRDAMTIGAYSYIDSLNIGLVVQIDASEADAGSVQVALQLAGCSVGAVACSMLLLAYLTSRLLRSMDDAWDEGKRSIEAEKQQFCRVIEAMYPPLVAKRVLIGDSQIVYHVSNACVFFSDIYEFTATCNALTPEELIQFMGYTFGSMDAAADHFHVYKVKTIGDAYLGVSGLPGSESPSGNCALDVLRFASCCAQVFSSRYNHPEEGAILDVASRALLETKRRAEAEPRPAPLIGEANNSHPATPVRPPAAGTNVHCIMRYGIALGPITAGVLQGKTPLFDIWGKTVNLASRMESTGVPGRVQVSEGVYQAIVRERGQPFTFDTRHKVYCKGFGHVSAYFLNTSNVAPPKDLLISMRIKPNLGRFFFDTVVPGFRVHSKATPSGGQASSHGSSGHRSEHSSVVSGGHVRANDEAM